MSQKLLNAYGAHSELEAENLVQRNLPLVRRVVGRMAIQLPPGVDREDLEEVGIMALLSASQSYDPSRGASFQTFAYLSIRGAVLDELRRLDVLPRSRRDSLRAYEKTRGQMRETLGRDPTFAEVQEELGLTSPELEELLRAKTLSDSFRNGFGESTTGVDPGSFPADLRDDPVRLAALNEAKERLADAIASLPKRSQEVVLLYYQGGLLLREIGQVLDLTDSRVSQILHHALVMLNQRMSCEEGVI